MKFQHKLYLILFLLATTYGYSQTVFVTGEVKDTREKHGLFDEAAMFSNFSFALPFRGNPNYGTNDPEGGNSGTWFIPDGLNIQGGFGVHTTETIALSLNTGIDGLITPKLVPYPFTDRCL